MTLYVKFATGSFEQRVVNETHAALIMKQLSKHGPILEYKLQRLA